MQVAIVSDIHGNLQALEAVLAQIEASECRQIWCLGDIVGYGGDPQRCTELVAAASDLCLAGNHDLGVIGAISIGEFSDVAYEAAMWTREQLDTEAVEFLRTLEPKDERMEVGLYHASPRDPVWEYVLSPLQAELCFDASDRRVCLIGHTHVPLEFHRAEGETATGETRGDGTTVDISAGRWMLNPGSVGQPRDGDPRAAWMELDTASWTATYRRVAYDVDAAQWAIRAARLPDSLAERLAAGQ